MPIYIKNYKWSQTADSLTIRVPIRNISASSTVDIFTCEKYVKINFPPYIFEVILRHAIVESSSLCKILENEAKFYLKKRDSIMWDTLESEPISKADELKVKESLIRESAVLAEAKRKEKEEQKVQLNQSIILEEVKREGSIKDEIKQIHEREFKNKIAKSVEEKTKPNNCVQYVPPTKTQNIVPKVRAAGNIVVTFSNRQFATAQRESQHFAEQEWLLKQHEAMKTIGFIEQDLSADERNPVWLKEKGNDFYKKENYLAAISAYSTGIKIASKYYELYLRRSAAHFALGNFKRCIEDCSIAYDLLTPHTPSNAAHRYECLARRGRALAEVGLLAQGHDEIQTALKLDSSDSILLADLNRIKLKLQTKSAS